MDDEKRNPIDFGTRDQRSRSTLVLCVWNLVAMIQTAVLVRSLSNFTCKFTCGWWEEELHRFWAIWSMSRSTLPPPPREGMPCLALSILKWHRRRQKVPALLGVIGPKICLSHTFDLARFKAMSNVWDYKNVCTAENYASPCQTFYKSICQADSASTW